MPAKTKKQYRFMQAVAHGKAKGIPGLSADEAKEFIKKTPKKKRGMFMKGRD